MGTRKPRRKDRILSRQLGDEWMLYDSDSGTVHIINPMAEFIWNLCDGSNDLDDLERHTNSSFDVPEGTDVRKNLEDIIQNFADLKVIEFADD
jgi:PqqD family protein of HPr-rel-A system